MAIPRLYPVDTKDLMPEIKAFVRRSQLIEGIEQILLFGSMAREEMTAASDIDLAVIFTTRENAIYHKSTLRQIKNQTISWPCDIFVCDRSWFDQRRVLGGVCMLIDSYGKTLYSSSDKRDHNGA
jgi:predicted nucleotidyltransferase